MNSTANFAMSKQEYYIVYSLSGVFYLITTLIATFIIITVRRTKPRLHTCRHLLICNSSVALIFLSTVQCVNFISIIFLPWETSDINCRWPSYFTYMSILAVIYSYFIQSISRLFFAVFSTKYRFLITFKAHFILILLHWLAVSLMPLFAIKTQSIRRNPSSICWVRFTAALRVGFTIVAQYLIPLLSIIAIYAYYRAKRVNRGARHIAGRRNHRNRHLEPLRNIIASATILLIGGVPNILFVATRIKIFYCMVTVTYSFCAVIVQIFAILLNRNLRDAVRNVFVQTPRVIPSHNINQGQINQSTLSNH